MSRIYFHNIANTAELRGSERAYAGGLSTNYLSMALGINRYIQDTDPVMSLFPLDVVREARFHGSLSESIRIWLVVKGMNEAEGLRCPDGTKVEIFATALNTMLVSGTDPIKLLARLHGQCELHGYIEGSNRAWLADIIERGRAAHILRVDQGWEGIVKMLRSADDTPVVTSYSVTCQWPNPYGLDDSVSYEDDPAASEAYTEAFYALPAEQRWDRAMPNLRKLGDGNLEMRPDQWQWPDYTFGAGESGYSLLAGVYAAKAA